MSYEWQVHLFLATGLFIVGTVVGSFLNVCIYRLPLQKSLIWPDSRCPKCLGRIGALENIPILSWLFLRGACRNCGLRISPRYPMIEAVTGVLFVAIYFADAHFGLKSNRGMGTLYLAVGYHCVLVAILLAISMIDYDWTIVPHELTNFGVVFGVLAALLDPAIRPVPASATTTLGALGVGVLGVLIGAGLVWVVRVVGGLVAGREAMGAGDIHILAVVGAFMGWQAAILTFFLSAFFGLIPALAKLIPYLVKRLTGRQWNPSDREIPLGPFLSMAAVTLLLFWHWAWPRVFAPYYDIFAWLVRDLLGQNP
jgi:leader peptidase (prepilin peptidase)/N-methyltransferase